MIATGTVAAGLALWWFSAHGFASGGHLPVAGVLVYAAGVALVGLAPGGADD